LKRAEERFADVLKKAVEGLMKKEAAEDAM
jgi:hypothetical protein